MKTREILKNATNMLQEKLGRTDFQVTEIPAEDCYCVCLPGMEFQTVSIVIEGRDVFFEFCNIDTWEVVDCDTLDAAFDMAINYEKSKGDNTMSKYEIIKEYAELNKACMSHEEILEAMQEETEIVIAGMIENGFPELAEKYEKADRDISNCLFHSYGIFLTVEEIRKLHNEYMLDPMSYEYREMLRMGEKFKIFQICIGLVEYYGKKENDNETN